MKKTLIFRKLLKEKEIIPIPGAFNALVAKLIEAKGFDAVYCTGGGISTSIYGLPDIGLITLTEMAKIAKNIADAVDIPVISDADIGYGNAINVMRTVREFEQAGIVGIQLEDQSLNKRCGHVDGKELIQTKEMVGKIRAAVTARSDPDFVIISRTDAKAVLGLKETIYRALAYKEAGADVIFPEALESKEEFVKFAKAVKGISLMANMTDFGKTPYFTTEQFKEMGYKIVIFPMAPMRVAMKAIDELLNDLKIKGTQIDWLKKMQTRKELYDLINYPQYIENQNIFLTQGGINPL